MLTRKIVPNFDEGNNGEISECKQIGKQSGGMKEWRLPIYGQQKGSKSHARYPQMIQIRLSPSATVDTPMVAMMVTTVPDMPVAILSDFADGHASLAPAFIALPPTKPHRV